jgi:proteasome alpha subunit
MYPNIQAYDRGVMFNPDGRLFQVEYAKEAVRKGATSIGLIAKDSVVFVAHNNRTSGSSWHYTEGLQNRLSYRCNL